MVTPSFRAQLINRSTYNRPLNDEGTVFETWEQTVDRVIGHQRWLWERAQHRTLSIGQEKELEELRQLMLDRKVSVSGRTLWLGGTEVAKKREASQFNCAFSRIEDVYDVVDAFWLLLQGCGVGFEPVTGTLNGFTERTEIEIYRSTRNSKGCEHNVETLQDGVWILKIGDSAESWAKAVGKLMVMKHPVKKIILDFSEIRPAGQRLKGYGWISSGDETFAKALEEICKIMNRRAGQLLTRMDILDLMNWLGTTLSSRRSAEIAVVPFTDLEAEEFALAKKDHYEKGQPQRAQSNNSLVFWHKPTKLELKGLFQQMLDAGGSEPGFINGVSAKKRAPWFKGVNPCAEILLGNKSFCNLVEVDTGKFVGDFEGLLTAVRYAARANYRQTCVNLKDGVLSDSWHELNEFLRLCGVGLTGLVKWLEVGTTGMLTVIQYAAREGCLSMADELGLPHAKAVTTIKPSGTLSKIMDTTEGLHKPLGKYIFNNIRFSIKDPIVEVLEAAGYRVFDDPYAADGRIVTVPVSYEDVKFEELIVNRSRQGLDNIIIEVNRESAITQLERYKLVMDNYVDHNASITVSYAPEEVAEIVDWLHTNWDKYVGVAWLLRNDPTKTAKDLGYPYLPQEVVTKEAFDAYASQLKPVDLEASAQSLNELDVEDCVGGVCPVR